MATLEIKGTVVEVLPVGTGRDLVATEVSQLAVNDMKRVELEGTAFDYIMVSPTKAELFLSQAILGHAGLSLAGSEAKDLIKQGKNRIRVDLEKESILVFGSTSEIWIGVFDSIPSLGDTVSENA